MKAFLAALGAVPTLVLGAGAIAAETSSLATLRDAKGAEVGTVQVRETASGTVWLTLSATGLPVGTLGFHIHETGACDADGGFKSAGGHLAGDRQHGVLNQDGPHPGDLPNIHVPEGGSLVYETFLARGAPSERSWIERVGLFDGDGSVVVIHARPDDYRSPPSGEAGDRIACGVLEKR